MKPLRSMTGPLAAFLLVATGAAAEDFDYFVLALSWSPSFCEAEGGERDREQCAPDRGLGYTLHGLWPQFENGYPEFCTTSARDPSRSETAAMADIMGSVGLAWYQWKKHGRCTGLSAEAYFDTSRLAYTLFEKPEPRAGEMSADEVEMAFLDANPGLDPEEVIVTCRGDYIREVRICLDTTLTPRSCGPDVLRSACRYRGDLDLPPIR